jgi:hypothetical protein
MLLEAIVIDTVRAAARAFVGQMAAFEMVAMNLLEQIIKLGGHALSRSCWRVR